MEQGFNHNIEHCGLLFHIQTEDSGRAHCALRTHLFHDGQILTSTTNNYGRDAVSEDIQAAMKTQHKAMVSTLVSGGYDTLIQEGGIELQVVSWPIEVPEWLSSRPPPTFLKPATRHRREETEPDTTRMKSTISGCSTGSVSSSPVQSQSKNPLVDVVVTALDDD